MRADELAAHEESLEAWKAQFKSEAVRQIAERESLLTEWQARLERRQAEVEEAQRTAEVSCGVCVVGVRGGGGWGHGFAEILGWAVLMAFGVWNC